MSNKDYAGKKLMYHNRDYLLKELQSALDVAGANPKRWPNALRARLAAFVESDEDAARLFAETKALDHILSQAPQGKVHPEIVHSVLSKALQLPQTHEPFLVSSLDTDASKTLEKISAAKNYRTRYSYFGSATLLAASLLAGIYIGLSGQAVTTLRGIQFLAYADTEAGIVFSSPLFGAAELYEDDRL